jgi:hypothetical protein
MPMNDRALAQLVAHRAQLAQDIKEATEERKFLDEQLKEHLASIATETLEVDQYKITLVGRTTRRLDKKLLLAAGVTPKVIASCEKESHSDSIRVTSLKEDS